MTKLDFEYLNSTESDTHLYHYQNDTLRNVTVDNTGITISVEAKSKTDALKRIAWSDGDDTFEEWAERSEFEATTPAGVLNELQNHESKRLIRNENLNDPW